VPPNEAVEKPDLGEPIPPGKHRQARILMPEGGWPGGLIRKGSLERPKSMDFADIVYQSEPRTRPLDIDLGFGG
jgi:hypothetical protein